VKLADLLEEFNVVIDTAEGLTELRSLILGLAVRGKLVPQDPNDEPASELLKKIEAEKERLYEEGEFPKPKKLKEIKDDEFPFDIPDNWKWVKFGRIMDFRGGSQPPKSKFIDSPKEGYVQLIQIRDLGDKPQPVYVPKDSVTKLCTSDDIMIGRYGASVGKVFWGKDGAYNVALIKILFGKQNLNSGYLYQFFNSDLFQNALAGISRSAQAGFNKGNVLPQPFPLPPLAEQHRIVKKIESLFAEVDELEAKLNQQVKLDDKLQKAVNAEVQQAPDADASKSAWSFITSNFDTLYHTPQAIDNLKKNILNEAVRGRLVTQDLNDEPASKLLKKIEAEKDRLYDEGEIRKPKKLPSVKEDEISFEIPESWEWCKFEVLCEIETNLVDPKDYADLPHIAPNNIEKETGKLLPFNTIEEDGVKSNKHLFKKNRILYSKIRPRLSKLVMVDFVGLCSADMYPLKPYPSMDYFFFYMLSSTFYSQVIKTDTRVAMPKTNQSELNKTLVPLPPLEEQHRIVLRIEELFDICDRFKAQLEKREKVNERLVKGLVGEVLEEN